MIKRKEKDMIPEERKSTKDWYLTLICMSIPIIVFFYLVTLALTGDESRRQFAKAVILYHLTIAMVAIIILLIAFKISIPYIEWLLDYLELL